MTYIEKRRGRPSKIDSRCEQHRLRMNKEEKFWLDNICKNEGISKASALRILIKIGYEMSKKGLFNGYPKNEEYDYLFNGYPKNEEDEDYNWWLIGYPKNTKLIIGYPKNHKNC